MAATIHSEPGTFSSARTNVESGVCPLCGAPLHNPGACDRCDWTKGYGEQPAEMRRNPRDLFACILSLFWPGAGHFYKGQNVLAAALAAGGVLCLLWSLTFLMFFGFLIMPVYWVLVAAQAFFLKDIKHVGAPPRRAGKN